MGLSSEPFCQTWPTWGTASDGLATALTKPVERPTVEIGCSSSGTWQTPDATNRERDEETLAKCAAFRKRNANQNSVPPYLAESVATWPTPDSVPDAPNTGSNSVNVVPGLGNRAEQWPTASVADAVGGHLTRGGARSDEMLLPGLAKVWPTPQADNQHATNEFKIYEHHGLDLGMLAGHSPQAPATSKPGTDYCSEIRSLLLRSPGKRRLNSEFVQKMMGFPEGWLD